MRPKKKDFTLAAASAAGFMTTAVLTGAGPTFTTIAGAPGDGLGHLPIITSSANISTIVFTLTGTNQDGIVITEAITGVNANSITGAKFFKTLTSVSISATLGANTASIGWGSTWALTQTFPTDFAKLSGPLLGVGLDGTTVTWTAQYTNADIFADPLTDDWFTLGTAGSTTNLAAIAPAGTTAVRVSVTSQTNGVLEISLSQARV
jgi:hypothetical protein